MSENVHASEFRDISEQQLKGALACIPEEQTHRAILLTEVLRAVDHTTVLQALLPEEKKYPWSDLELLHAGWNLAIAHLLEPLPQRDVLPMRVATDESRNYALQLVHQLGRSVLLRRVADMVQYGYLAAERASNGFIVKKTAAADNSQFLDLREPRHWRAITEGIEKGHQPLGRWNLVKFKDENDFPTAPGAFLGRGPRPPFENWLRKNVDELMIPLIKPLKTSFGTIIGYDSTLEIEEHFLALVSLDMKQWQNEAGIHPDASLGGSTGADIAAVSTLIASMHIKHIRFSVLASKHHPEVAMSENLTIWESREKLERSLHDFTQMDIVRIRKALAAITLEAVDAAKLKCESRPCVPLLISLGNGLLMRPVSSVFWNPIIAAGKLTEWRESNARNTISAHRENWMRGEIHALFHGNRYVRVEGSIELRKNNRPVTDVDAAVFDWTTGELAVFQIKWQDYFTNDVRQLRSRSANQAKKLDEWAERVSIWFGTTSPDEILSVFRIGGMENWRISKVFLFGIAKGFIRTGEYGFVANHPRLALGTFAQLERVRFEVGPVSRVIQKVHDVLKLEHKTPVTCTPLPTTIRAANHEIVFSDLWNSVS